LISESNELRAILDLSGLSAGDHTLDIQIQIPTRPVRIVSATPQTAAITLEPLATRTFPINLSIAGSLQSVIRPGIPVWSRAKW